MLMDASGLSRLSICKVSSDEFLHYLLLMYDCIAVMRWEWCWFFTILPRVSVTECWCDSLNKGWTGLLIVYRFAASPLSHSPIPAEVSNIDDIDYHGKWLSVYWLTRFKKTPDDKNQSDQYSSSCPMKSLDITIIFPIESLQLISFVIIMTKLLYHKLYNYLCF